MFSDSTIHFLRTYEQSIRDRWAELLRQELSPEFLSGRWFEPKALGLLYSQIIDAFERRVYRDLNRTIDNLIRSEETPTPLDVKVLLASVAAAALEEFAPREESLRDSRAIRADLEQMGRSLKQVYSERLCPQLIAVLAENRDDLREQWLRDLPTARISNHFSILSEEDRADFIDQTLEIYEQILRGRELEPARGSDPQQPQTLLDQWVARQVDYFNPKGFDLVTVLRAVEHLPGLLEPMLARATIGDEWTYRVSQLLLMDARDTVVHGLSDAYMERFSKNFYGEVGIMLHRIKNKLTSVPTTMRTVLAIADEQYGQMFDPMVLTTDEAELLSRHDQLTTEVIAAEAELLAAGPNGNPAAAPDVDKLGPAMSRLKEADEALQAFLAEHGEQLEMIRMMKLDVGAVEMVQEMLGIVFEGGVQTQQLTEDLQLRMNEMYEREPPRREPIEVSVLLKAATEEAAVDARAKDIKFTVVDEAEGLRILGVRRDIARPFVQVIDNAIKYTPNEGEVDVVLRPDGEDHVLFYVKDTGIGIPPGEEEEVFSLCERCSNAKDFASGTGTGLYHDRITVMHHNGEMWVESGGIGKGTTMYIRLPVHQEAVTGD